MDIRNLSNARITGPFWEARVSIIRSRNPETNLALRTLFVEYQPRHALGQQQLFVPGTMLLLCQVNRVTIQPQGAQGATYNWRRQPGSSAPRDPSVTEIREGLAAGELALLLAQAPDDAWPEADDSQVGLPKLTCLAGDINLDAMQPDQTGQAPNDRQRLYRALRLTESAPDQGPLTGRLSVNASGLSLHGQAVLPWQITPVTAPFLLAQELPVPAPDNSHYRLQVEEERLTDLEKRVWLQSWFNLSSYLNPNHPLHEPDSEAKTPVWVTLEIADPLHVPGIYWRITEWEEDPANLSPHFKAGEFNLLLSDQELYESRLPSRSVAQIPLNAIQINVVPGDMLEIVLEAGQIQPEPQGQLQYEGSAQADITESWQETVSILDTVVAFNPVVTARWLRQSQDQLPPEWESGSEGKPIDDPILWGFMPLADGWAQLPLPNLTEQLYLDTQIANLDYPEKTTLIKGAFVMSNQQEAVLHQFPQEQPWQVTLTDLGYLVGRWRLQKNVDIYQLATISLDIQSPQCQLNGFFWLSSGKPTIEDAVPDLENWVSGLQSVPLRTFSSENDIFPPAVTMRVEAITMTPRPFEEGNLKPSSTHLGSWSFSYQTQTPTFADLVTAKALPKEMYGRYLPLLWRRHPTHPMVQVLPLTQSKSPPNHPSASRQLAVFELPADIPLRFGVGSEAGASSWPHYLGEVQPATEWRELPDLPLASLALPGIFLDPRQQEQVGFGQDPGLNLTQQYRYDLPYLDEIYALAQLPKKPQDPNEISPLPDAPRPEPERPLVRELLAAHWRQLAEKASLASVAGVTALRSENETLYTTRLIEPFRWPVQTILDLENYPGSFTLKNQDGSPPDATLSGNDGLAGVSGNFITDDDGQLHLITETAVSEQPSFAIVANSMAALAKDGHYRDQRGLWRSGSSIEGNLVKTTVYLQEAADHPYELTSTFEGIPLVVSETDSWQFWFRDVPFQAGEFLRSHTLSDLVQDINDPEAKSRQYNYLNGYEWRLGATSVPLRICGLTFYPLTLEKAITTDDQLTRLEISGRLQLPLAQEAELKELNNAVRLTFTAIDTTHPLQLTNIELDGPFVEWPLALQKGEQTEAPLLKWDAIRLEQDELNQPVLTIENSHLCFFLFDVEWNVSLKPIRFVTDVPELQVTNAESAVDAGQPLLPAATEIALNTSTGLHDAWQTIQMRLGHTARPSLQTAVCFPLMPQPSEPVEALSSVLFLDLEIGDVRLNFAANSLQMVWTQCEPVDTLTGPVQLLPGMPLVSRRCPGFAALTFTAMVPTPPAYPQLILQSAFVETLFTSRWGDFLQSGQLNPTEPLTQIFGSSAGELAFGYTVQWLAGSNGSPGWEESFLVNGMLEITNLISWPKQTGYDPETNTLTLPAAAQADTLDHIRHTVRILLNQHLISGDHLMIGEGALLFNLNPGKAWQFLAIVEHQLITVQPNATCDEFTLGTDQRWTTNQEIRLARPEVFQNFLQHMTGKIIDPAKGIANLDQQGGYQQQFIKEQLLDASSPNSLADLPLDTIIVEASAPHWIRKTPLAREEIATTARSSTTLQYLPNGSQLGTLMNLADYQDAAESWDSWLLLSTPFLGRLQTAVHDGLDEESRDGLNALQIDPVLRLHHRRSTKPTQPLPPLSLAFSSWGGSDPVTINLSPFDDAVVRSWPRLDPLSLAENWFRVQNPAAEATPIRTQSVMASFPNTPARLSRAAALQQTFDSFRVHYPPQVILDPPTTPTVNDVIEWREDSVLVWQDAGQTASPQDNIYAWQSVAAHLFSSHLGKAAQEKKMIYPAATIIPARLSRNGQKNPVPVSFAVSPYVAIDFQPAPEVDILKLVSMELLCLAPGTNSLRPATSLLREVAPQADSIKSFSLRWGREMAQRLFPESPLAILRFREILADFANPAQVNVDYTFDFISIPQPDALAKRVFRLRSTLKTLRAREGHFGGYEIPEKAAAFEVAPPQIVGAQPIYLTERPTETENGSWPWGISTLRFSSVVSAGRKGILGTLLHPGSENTTHTLWWQALPYQLMYRSALDDDGPAAGLPALFRAAAVDHFLPVCSRPALPDSISLVSEDEAQAGETPIWQPILPGQVRFHLLGSRAGAMFALRSHLIRQQGLQLDNSSTSLNGGQPLVSGSVPVQHRMPRPVPLPANNNVSSALRPWASHFEPLQNHLLTSAPADEAFFAARGDQGDKRLLIRMVSPSQGKITPDWNGELAFIMNDGEGMATLEDWELKVYLGGETPIHFDTSGCSETAEHLSDLHCYTVQTDLADKLKSQLQNLNLGNVLPLYIDVRPQLDIDVQPQLDTDNFYQSCAFPLRMASKTRFRLPLIPQFIHFEDPEYNRLLASTVKRAEKQFQVLAESELVMRSIILATDRREYNLDSKVAFRFDWDDSDSDAPNIHNLRIEFNRVGSGNVRWPLQLPDQPADFDAGKLHQFFIADLVRTSGEAQDRPLLNPGDRLQITIQFMAPVSSLKEVNEVEVSINLAVDIVAEPVIPVPQAAYALLRWQTIKDRDEVECVRFAWGPTAARIELINPDDLRTEIVRRRAVFHWTDSVRPTTVSGYVIQKIAQNGSTFIPESNQQVANP